MLPTDNWEENKDEAYENEDSQRLVQLLINEYKRKKNVDILNELFHYNEPIALEQKVEALMLFWYNSLTRTRLLYKLILKQ